MKYTWLVLIFLIIGCQSSAERSFNDLSKAFISLYYKFHPVESTKYSQKEFDGKFRKIDIFKNKEYLADVSRFIIELSQID